MKVVKKYEYRLTEKTLNEDIDRFIEKASPLKGVWAFEMRHGKLHFYHEQKNNNARVREILNMLVQEVKKSSNVKNGYKA